MAISAVRQLGPYLPAVQAADAETWWERLRAAFADANLETGLLALAEQAIAACPRDPTILLLGATAALLETRPQRALALLKRLSRYASGMPVHLLHALALRQLDKPVAARALLQRHGLLDPLAVANAFPGGPTHARWLIDQLDAIGLDGAPAHGRRPVTRGTGKARSAPGRGIADHPRKTPPAPAAKAPLLPPLPRIEIEIPFTIEFNSAPLLAGMARIPEPDGRWFALRERFAHLSLAQGFNELLCLPHLTGVEPFVHQIETVRKVLRQFRGRVLLADEVGLGKTVEAGMVLKEYTLRGMVERSLVLAPASLVGQWREELESKFDLAFATTYDGLLREDPQAFWAQDRIVASIATARRREHAERLIERQFDLVIVDEAHHLRDRSSQSWKLVDSLNKRFLLLLSATPVQNDLTELYNLLTLLKPGIFKTLKEFRVAYMIPGKPRQPANSASLRALMRDAMIRNTRAVVALKLPRRHATTISVDGGAGEAEAYVALAAAVRRLATEGAAARERRLGLYHLLSAAGSSPRAAAAAVARIATRRGDDPVWAELARRWAAVETSGKEAALVDLLKRNPSEKKLVFVHSRETLAHLAGRLGNAGISLVRYDGTLSGAQKDEAIAAFRDRASVLLCTQSGGEGRNIQFCNTLINYDVPWNPMTIEQRIGRIDRIGQDREVFVFSLVTRGTIEERILALLEEKIAMFELVVGELGAILGGLEEEREFPDLVLDAWLAATETARHEAFDELGARLEQARRQHDNAKALDAKLFGEDFETA